MGSRLGKIRRIRSFGEVMTRGGQALSVYREQRHGGREIPTDAEFVRLIDANEFGKAPIIAESLWQRFYKNGQRSFFPALADADTSAAAFGTLFGEAETVPIVKTANSILAGKFNLL